MAYSPTAITPLAQGYVPWADARPTKQLWVSPAGSDTNSGTSSAPFKTISAAMAKATPGTAVMVKAGTYTDYVRLKSGMPDKPIWLVSADGEGAAKVNAISGSQPIFFGWGNDNIVVKGFELIGGKEGVILTQSGSYLRNMVDNVVIQDNLIRGQSLDGIKLAQTKGAVVVGNTVKDVKGTHEGIDFFHVRDGIIAYNDIRNIQGQGAIVIKGGSEDIVVRNNIVNDVQRGIMVGGHAGGSGENWPANLGWQARDIDVKDNLIQDTSRFTALTQAGVDSTFTKNSFQPNNTYYTVAAVGDDNYGWHSRNIKFVDNITQRSSWLTDTHKEVTTNTGNRATGSFDRSKVGPDALDDAPQAVEPQPQPGPEPETGPVASVNVGGSWKDSAAPTQRFTGGTGSQTLTGTSGHDYIDGGSGTDTLIGGAGDDTYVASGRSEIIREQAGRGVDTVIVWDSLMTAPANVENMRTTRATGSGLTDNTLDNILTGGTGPDTFRFVSNHGDDLVRGFEVGRDMLAFANGIGGLRAGRNADGHLVVLDNDGSVTLAGIPATTPITDVL